MLDMARTAKTRKTSEIVRVMMESELKISNDPLSEDGSNQYPPGEANMCPRQSFLFHRHLAEIYVRRSDGASLMQKHLDKARRFKMALDTLAPPSIDLWTLLRLLPGYEATNIPEDLLNSLKWDERSLASNMRHCLEGCWETLIQTDSLPMGVQLYDPGQHEKMKPTDMINLALQNNPLHIWMKTSSLFIFFWKEIHGEAPPIKELPMISATQFLMVVSRMIVRRSLLIPKHNRCSLDSETKLSELPAWDQQVYRGVVLKLLQENLVLPNQMKREFVTEFVEHYSWSPPAAHMNVLAQQVKTYQMEALKSVLATRRDSRPITPTSTHLREVTALRAKVSEIRRTSTDNEFLAWLVTQEEQLASTSQRDTITYVKGSQYTPSPFREAVDNCPGFCYIVYRASSGRFPVKTGIEVKSRTRSHSFLDDTRAPSSLLYPANGLIVGFSTCLIFSKRRMQKEHDPFIHELYSDTPSKKNNSASNPAKRSNKVNPNWIDLDDIIKMPQSKRCNADTLSVTYHPIPSRIARHHFDMLIRDGAQYIRRASASNVSLSPPFKCTLVASSLQDLLSPFTSMSNMNKGIADLQMLPDISVGHLSWLYADFYDPHQHNNIIISEFGKALAG
ncbi:hypothetical protein ACLX1H_010237 [Fusarium chlamydosporum]